MPSIKLRDEAIEKIATEATENMSINDMHSFVYDQIVENLTPLQDEDIIDTAMQDNIDISEFGVSNE